MQNNLDIEFCAVSRAFKNKPEPTATWMSSHTRIFIDWHEADSLPDLESLRKDLLLFMADDLKIPTGGDQEISLFRYFLKENFSRKKSLTNLEF